MRDRSRTAPAPRASSAATKTRLLRRRVHRSRRSDSRRQGPPAAEIVFDHVTKLDPNSSQPAIDDLTVTGPAGEICVLIGPSGAGKTTAMRMVNRLVPITRGDMTIDGTSIHALDAVQCGAASAT